MRLDGTSASAQRYYRFIVDHAGSSNAEFRRGDASASTQLDVWTQTFTDADLWEFAVAGQPPAVVLTVYRNGSSVRTFTDTDNTGKACTGGYPGLYFSSVETSAIADNWVGADSGVPIIAPALAHRSFGPF